MNLILFDPENRVDLLPLVFTRPVSTLRVGIFTIQEKWEKRIDGHVSFQCPKYLSSTFRTRVAEDNYLVRGDIIPDKDFAHAVKALRKDEGLRFMDQVLAVRCVNCSYPDDLNSIHWTTWSKPVETIKHLWDIFVKNGSQILSDLELMDPKPGKVSDSNTVLGNQGLFVAESAEVEACILDSSAGPIYVGHQAKILPGSMIKGPVAICDQAVIKMGAKIYGDTTIGPSAKVGGELSNVVFIGNSNKGHDGYLGNSVIGEWCNLGADTNASNLKNNYMPVKIWNYNREGFQSTGEQFCGLIMADHSKCGINTMFNTGTVVGVGANIFGEGFPRTFIPSFSWGGKNGFVTHQLDKMLETAKIVKARRDQEVDSDESEILQHVFNETAPYRSWEK